MRLLELRLERYGHFESVTLPLDATGCRLHVILGSNEAGKSTLLDAISDLLFGFPARSPYGFRFDNKLLRVGAAIESADGTRLEVVRRKGTKNTLVTADNEAVDDAILSRMLGGATRAVFEDLFALNEERLREGGRDFVAGKGNVGEALFSASGLVADVRKVLDRLDTEAAKLWAPNVKKAVVPSSLVHIAELEKERAKVQLSVAAWQTSSRNAEKASAAAEKCEQRLRERRRERDRLERIRRCSRPVQELRACEQVLAELATVPLLSEIPVAQRGAAEARLREAEEKLDASRVASTELERQLGESPPRAPILDHAVDIRLLGERRAVASKALADLPRRAEEISNCEESIESLGREAGLPGLGRDGEGLPAEAVVERVRRISGEYSGVEKTVAAAESNLREQADDLQSKRTAAEPPLPPDPAPLRAILESTARFVDHSAQAEQARQDARARREDAGSKLLRLNPATPSLDALRTMPVPLDETIGRHEGELAECEREVRTAKERIGKVRHELETRRRDLATAEAAGRTSTEEALRDARSRREDAWARLRDTVVDGSAGPSKREIGEPLADAFEVHVREADSIADARYRDANTIARIESQREEIARREEDAHEESERLHRAEGRHASAKAAWAEAWLGTGVVPLPPAEMRLWNAQRREILDLLSSADGLESNASSLAKQEAAAADDIGRELAGLGIEKPPGATSLTGLRAHALAWANRLDAGRVAHATAAQALEDARIGHSKAEREWADAVRARDEWKRTWDSATAPLGRDTPLDPADAELVLGRIDSARTEKRARRDLLERIKGMERDVEEFRSEALELARVARLDSSSTDPIDLADALLRELATAEKEEQARTGLAEKLETSRRDERSAEEAAQRSRDELAKLATLLGTESAAGLADAEARAERKRSKTKERDSTIDRLRAEGDLAAIREEVEAADLASIEQDIRRLSDEIEALEKEHKALAEKSGAAQKEMESQENLEGSAGVAQDEENETSRLRSAVEQWVRLRVASTVLGRALENYREKNQDPLVAIASERFRSLTAGAFERLATDLGDEGPELRAVRAQRDSDEGTQERVLSTGLSLGTADQLFLALRLAAVERYCAASEPLPFVADDLLPSFDDDRTRAAIASLAKLGETTQVLLFTHHAAVADLARESLGPAVRIHRLADLQRQDPAATKGA